MRRYKGFATGKTYQTKVGEGFTPPVIEICADFNGGRSKPLPYGSSRVAGLNSESCQGSLLRELSPEATEGVKFIKVKGRSRSGGILFTTSSAAPAGLNFFSFYAMRKSMARQ